MEAEAKRTAECSTMTTMTMTMRGRPAGGGRPVALCSTRRTDEAGGTGPRCADWRTALKGERADTRIWSAAQAGVRKKHPQSMGRHRHGNR